MIIAKTIRLILISTAICVFCVWQQTQIVKLSYNKQDKISLCSQLLDRNTFLRYNLMMLESSGNLSKSLVTFDDSYEMPHFSQIVDLRSRQEKDRLALNASKKYSQVQQNKEKPNLFLSLFSPRSQAEAQIQKTR